MFYNTDVKPIIISPPFGTFVCTKWSTSVVGTYTKNRRRCKWTRIIRTLRRTEKGWVNNIGLKNPGLKGADMIFKFKHLNKIPTIFSIHGKNEEEWIWIHDWLQRLDISNLIVELNISCPNVPNVVFSPKVLKLFGDSFPNTIVKLQPHLDLAKRTFDSAYANGITNFHCCNTLATYKGGESGYALKPYSLKVIESLKKLANENVNLIGGGGIYAPQDVIDYHNAGANMLSLSTIFFTPWKVSAVKKQIEETIMTECKHEKVYDNNILTTNPPQQNWVCRKCGERGTEVVGKITANEYDAIIKHFKKENPDD